MLVVSTAAVADRRRGFGSAEAEVGSDGKTTFRSFQETRILSSLAAVAEPVQTARERERTAEMVDSGAAALYESYGAQDGRSPRQT